MLVFIVANVLARKPVIAPEDTDRIVQQILSRATLTGTALTRTVEAQAAQKDLVHEGTRWTAPGNTEEYQGIALALKRHRYVRQAAVALHETVPNFQNLTRILPQIPASVLSQ